LIPQYRFDKTKQHSAVTVWKLGLLWWLSCNKLFSLSPTHPRPSGEVAAHRVTTSEKQTLYKVEHPILPIDPLYHQDVEPQELKDEIKKLHSDKSRGWWHHNLHDPSWRPQIRGNSTWSLWHTIAARNPTKASEKYMSKYMTFNIKSHILSFSKLNYI